MLYFPPRKELIVILFSWLHARRLFFFLTFLACLCGFQSWLLQIEFSRHKAYCITNCKDTILASGAPAWNQHLGWERKLCVHVSIRRLFWELIRWKIGNCIYYIIYFIMDTVFHVLHISFHFMSNHQKNTTNKYIMLYLLSVNFGSSIFRYLLIVLQSNVVSA